MLWYYYGRKFMCAIMVIYVPGKLELLLIVSCELLLITSQFGWKNEKIGEKLSSVKQTSNNIFVKY